MSTRKKDAKLDRLQTEVGAASNTDEVKKVQDDALAQLTEEHERLQADLNALRVSLRMTTDERGADLKREIAKHPIQSTICAFALGFAASLLLRR